MHKLNYNYMPNGIHHYDLDHADQNGVDKLIEELGDVYQTTNKDEPLFVILELKTMIMLPIRHLALKLRDLVRAHPERTQSYFALVLDDALVLDVTSALFKTIMRRDAVQYFTKLDKAELWLQIEQKKRAKQHN